jgi:hypothetical protein
MSLSTIKKPLENMESMFCQKASYKIEMKKEFFSKCELEKFPFQN